MRSVFPNLLSLRSMLRAQSTMRGLLLVVVIALLTFMIALFGGFMHAISVADEATWDNERSQLNHHLEIEARAMLAAQTVQLTWDDAMRHAGGQDRPVDVQWADTYIGKFLWDNQHVDRMFLIGSDGRVIRSWERGAPVSNAGYAQLAPRVAVMLGRMRNGQGGAGQAASRRQLEDIAWQFDASGRPFTHMTYELARHDGQAAILTAASIIPDNDYGLLKRAPNNLVSVRFIDAGMVQRLADALLLKEMRYTPDRPAAGKRNALELKGQQGESLGWLSWEPNDVGAIVVRRTVPLLVTYFAFYLFVLFGGILFVRQAIRLAREYAAREARAQRNALHDPMLGLPNRTMVMQRLNKHLANLGLTGEGEALYLAYVDLDHFKAVNDTIGHHVGDELLIEAVRRLKGVLSEGDMLGRLASDEFVILHRSSGGREPAETLGRLIMEAFAEPFHILGHTLQITASCGLSWAPDHTRDATEMLRLADIALSRAKQRGRARYRCFTEDMNSTIRWRQDMEVELRRAIAGDELEMLYQPIVNIADRKVVCFESLLRWTHEDRGRISPGIFVPLAESCGLMPQLGEWVLRRVFTDSPMFGDAELSVNLSPLQITARDFMATLRSLVDEFAINPRNFIFEITEGVLLDNSQHVLDVLGEIREMGFRIALDDFGTGYSSLGYLRSFQFDRIKVDRSFVQGIENDLDAQAILKAVVSLGRTLRMKVVAEGVETLLQQQLVEAAGCELIQGHLYWRALTATRASALVAHNRKAVPGAATDGDAGDRAAA